MFYLHSSPHVSTRISTYLHTFYVHSHYTIVPFRYNFSLSHSLSLYIYTYTFGEKETKEKTAFRGQLSRINPHLCDCKFIECLGYYSYEIDWKMKQEDNGGEKKKQQPNKLTCAFCSFYAETLSTCLTPREMISFLSVDQFSNFYFSFKTLYFKYVLSSFTSLPASCHVLMVLIIHLTSLKKL